MYIKNTPDDSIFICICLRSACSLSFQSMGINLAALPHKPKSYINLLGHILSLPLRLLGLLGAIDEGKVYRLWYRYKSTSPVLWRSHITPSSFQVRENLAHLLNFTRKSIKTEDVPDCLCEEDLHAYM